MEYLYDELNRISGTEVDEYRGVKYFGDGLDAMDNPIPQQPLEPNEVNLAVLVNRGDKIRAIQMYRRIHEGAGLWDAAAAIDAMLAARPTYEQLEADNQRLQSELGALKTALKRAEFKAESAKRTAEFNEEKYRQRSDNFSMLFRAVAEHAPQVWDMVKDQLIDMSPGERDKTMSWAMRYRELAQRYASERPGDYLNDSIAAAVDEAINQWPEIDPETAKDGTKALAEMRRLYVEAEGQAGKLREAVKLLTAQYSDSCNLPDDRIVSVYNDDKLTWGDVREARKALDEGEG